MNKPLTVYKASAGSGKTFRLAVEYIKLVISNPQAYRNILAVTFTNKATEEMKMRILSQLYGIWKQLPDSKPYAERVTEELQLEPDFVSRQAGTALHLLLHNYSYFRVMTIDTFFQSVLRNLARELDLTANLRIGLNDTQVEEMAVDQMIDSLSTTDKMLQWILNYIMENISDDRSWNVIGQIKQFGRTIFRDYYKEHSRQLHDTLAEPAFFDHYKKTLIQMKTDAANRMAQLADSFFDTLEAEGLSIEDFSYGKSGVCGFFLKLRNGVFDESIEGKRVTDSLGQPDKWYKKTHPRRELIHQLADGTLGSLLRQAIEERPRQWKLYQSATLTLRHLSQLRLLSSIEQQVRQLNQESNRFLLSDTQQLLHELISDSDSPFIFEKIGSQLEHIMIDEFQDTSTVQWQNFRVLLQETMSHEDSHNLIVGDVKQSIYRWRSGDWRLLNDIEQLFPGDLTPAQPLDTNRRSLRNIIEFNNAFFTAAAQWEYLQLDDNPEAQQLKRAYEQVTQKVPEGKACNGYVNIKLLTADDYDNQVLTTLSDTISLLTTSGIKPGRIAILVRANRYIPLIANYLSVHHPSLNIISDEAFRLNASLAVNIIVQALHLLTHPDDNIVRAFLESSCGTLPEQYNRQLLTLPLTELVERLFQIFNLERFTNQTSYLSTFHDQLAEYLSDHTGDIDEFVREWDDHISSVTIQAEPSEGIRIISIHKSKGLEFDNVIIPYCDWQLEKSSGNIMWCSPQTAPFNQLPVVPIDFSQKGMKGTIYEKDYHHEHLQNMVDNLNLLYVALTRAAQNLFIIGHRNTKSSRSTLIEAILPQLHETLSANGKVECTLNDAEQQPIDFEYGTLYVPDAPVSTVTTPHPNPFLQKATPIPVLFNSYSSKAEFQQSNRSLSFVSGEDESTEPSYIKIGSVLHQLFSTIRTTEDIPNALQQLQNEGILFDEHITLDRITHLLKKRLEHPKVLDWFSPRWTLYNECTILTVDESGHVCERRPDRVMHDGRQWVVVDFKFGSSKPEYFDQVRQYMQLLQQMGHQPVKGYLWYVYSNRIEEVK